jgi:DNA replicative helicase MCM subunit Mcm2 (Cdc46/Mcm family)
MGLMATAVGGVLKRIDPTKIRGELNVLIVGSPATGKTQCLKFMERVRSNTVYVNGRQTSAIGLIAGVQGGDAGASGLWARRRQVFLGAYGQAAADGCVCVDEITKADDVRGRSESLASVLDDNQEIIIAKSGLFKKLVVNCASLHAGNPRANGGIYDKRLGLAEQMDEAFWLLSRYDLVFVLVSDDQKDRFASLRHSVSETYRRATHGSQMLEPINTTPLTPEEERFTLEGEFYPPDYLAAEIEFLRPQKPTLEVGSPQWGILMEFWEKFSNMKMRGVENVDVFDQRKFNSLIRVSEAIAKLWRSEIVGMDHVQEAINLFRVSISNIAHVPNPDLGYVRFARWLVEQFIDMCYYCNGKGCEACDTMGGRPIPVAYSDCADYPWPDEARNSWDYLVAMGGLVRMEESLGGQAYRITDVCREIAQGGWRETEERDIAAEALAMMHNE